MNLVKTVIEVYKLTAKERFLLTAASLIFLVIAWATIGPAQALAEDCAASGVTCNAILPLIPPLAILGAVGANLGAVLPWGFDRLQERQAEAQGVDRA